MDKNSAVRLGSSGKILEWPDGDLEDEVLEDILQEASEEELDLDSQIMVTYHERASDYTDDNKTYSNVPYEKSLKELQDIYRDIYGHDFKPKSYEQVQENILFKHKYGQR